MGHARQLVFFGTLRLNGDFFRVSDVSGRIKVVDGCNIGKNEW